MPLNSVALSVALTPTVLSTFFSHYIHRKSHHHKPSVHISYDEAIQIIREFLFYASKHPIEDIQGFTSQRVPSPMWVRTEKATIGDEFLNSAADAIIKELGPKGIASVGGKTWWQWRGPSEDLLGEWIEMRNDFNERKNAKGVHSSRKRIMLYIHGGAYFFGSLESHRFMMQRHARKLKGRVFARFLIAQYRLAPQYPFPCALQDCLAAYLFLLTQHKPDEIVFAGDSAGGGLIVSMLVVMREQGLPKPSGAILISPWVDLTHSFPSVCKDNPGDYIPPYGFRNKPSAAWPPPNSDEVAAIKRGNEKKADKAAEPAADSQQQETDERGFSIHNRSETANEAHQVEFDEPENIKVPIDGKEVEVKDQIHAYAPNHLLNYPLVSPVLQSSLGGLCPLLVLTGGGEMLRDEQIYLAHKAANPMDYPPNDEYLEEYDPKREKLNKYPGTYTQLQVWDDLCHVAPTLSFTRPAKYMYRSIAQFGAWALACSQESEIEILDDDEISPSSSSDTEGPNAPEGTPPKRSPTNPISSIGAAGDPLPPFKDRMVRQRVDKRGNIYPLDPPSSLEALQFPRSQVGVINPALVKKWLGAKEEWDKKFAKEKLHVQQQRIKELSMSFQEFNGELPPACSIAARKAAPGVVSHKKLHKSYPMTMWSNWANKHDERTLERETKKEGSSRKTSVEAGRAGASLKDPQANGDNNTPTTGNPNDINTDKANDSAPDEKPATNGSADGENATSRSPMIVLPPYTETKPKEENASTLTLFHAPGTLPLRRPVSQADSGTIRSGITSDVADDVSTVDSKSVGVPGTGVDAASTRAVINSKGVIGSLGDNESAYHSVDAFSLPRSSGDLDTMSTRAMKAEGQTPPARPDMPERELFKTADEYAPQ